MGAWSLAGGMFHYKKGSAYKTSADSAVLYQDVASNTLLNDVFCYFVHNLPKFQNMHPYRITPGTDIPEHVGTTYPALPGPPAVPETYFLIRHSVGPRNGDQTMSHNIYIRYRIRYLIRYRIRY